MNFSELCIRKPVMTTLLMLSILVFGLFSYIALPVSSLPNIDLPVILVSASYPGANPETMANAIVTPLEQQLMAIQSLRTTSSTSKTGSASIVLQFNLNRNIDEAATDVQAAITAALPNLPQNMPSNPIYSKVNPSATPILYFSVTSNIMTAGELYDYANVIIGQRISTVEGVSNVDAFGAPYAVRIQIDPEKLAAKNIGLDHVTQIIQNANVNLPTGVLYGPKTDYTIEADGQIFDAAGYGELIIKNENGDLVKIKEVGRALDSTSDDKYSHMYITRKAAQASVVLSVQRLPGVNTLTVIEKIREVLKELRPQLPADLEITTIYDDSESILQGVDEVKLSLVLSFILVVLIVYFFLGKIQNTIIPSLALPISIFGTASILLFFGYSMDILSLVAITLSLGFLIDDAIVVLENTVRRIQAGEAPFDASVRGAKEIFPTILSMTLCLVAVLIPMLFLGGVVGMLFRDFAITIFAAVLFSGFVSLTLTPMLCSIFTRPYHEAHQTKMERFSDKWNLHIKKFYEPRLHWALNHGLIMLGLGIFSVIASFFFLMHIPTDFLPAGDVGYIQGFSHARDGTSPFQMVQYHKQLYEIAIADPNVHSIISISSRPNASEGIFFFRLKPLKDRLPIDDVIGDLSEKFQKVAGINIYLAPLPLINLNVGSTVQALYQYAITSVDLKPLYDYTPKLIANMKANHAFDQVSSDLRSLQPQWNLHILRDKAFNYNVNAADIENFLQYAYSDNRISQINAAISQYNVLIETLPNFYKDPSVLSKLYVRSSTDALVPLSEMVQTTETVGPLTVNHINGLPAVNISFNPGKGVPLGTVLDTLHTLTRDAPAQIKGQVVGTADVFKSSMGALPILATIAIFLVYIILGILYESFIHPLTVMSALPPAFLGGLFSLYITRQPLSIYSFVGLILLAGIVLKNGIMMINFAIDAVEIEKKSAYDAIVEASLIRLRPILMTTAAALMGAVPIAIGFGGALADSLKGLGICVIGGLLISQMLTLFLTPVLYYYFEIFQEKLEAWKNRHSPKV